MSVKGIRVILTASVWGVATIAVGLAMLTVGPRLVGGKSYAVLSNSMRGAVDTGDQVIVMPRRMSEIKVGEIVAFRDPEGSGRLLQHRVQRTRPKGREIEVLTMGDANTGWERWSLPASHSVGRVVAVIPLAGYLIGPIGDPLIRQLLGAMAWLSVMALLLFMIWGRRPESGVGTVAE